MKNNLKHIYILLLLIVCSNSAYSQTAVVVDSKVLKAAEVPSILYNTSFYYVAFLFLIMLIVIIVMARVTGSMAKSMVPTLVATEEKKAEEAIAQAEKPSLWEWVDRNVLTKAVPIEQEADVMLDHNYDGIKELDNNLPPWWKWGFYLTIVWSFVYIFHYHVFATGKLQKAEYNNELAVAEAQSLERAEKMKDYVSADNVLALNDEGAITAGKDIYVKNCVACHGANGEGGVGPNFADEYWIHGGGIKNIFKIVTNGVAAKGMISWKSQLSPKQIQQVGSYILSFQGTKPANPKEPQGDVWVDPTTSIKNDTSVVTTDSSAIATAVKTN
jgi:cytochrome c oxidase cbb3-type subunit 3